MKVTQEMAHEAWKRTDALRGDGSKGTLVEMPFEAVQALHERILVMEDALALGENYSLYSLLLILADAADHLYHEHDCDFHRWACALARRRIEKYDLQPAPAAPLVMMP